MQHTTAYSLEGSTMWTRSDTIEGNGHFWHDASSDTSAFEDTGEGSSRWYAWIGTPDDHDDAGHGPVRDTLADAVEGLDRIIEGLDSPDDV